MPANTEYKDFGDSMSRHMNHKFSHWPLKRRTLAFREFTRFICLASETDHIFLSCSGEIDQVWHAYIIETQEYADLCKRVASGGFVHHSSLDFPTYRKATGRKNTQDEDLSVLVSYVHNFGDFETDAICFWPQAKSFSEQLGGIARLNKLCRGIAITNPKTQNETTVDLTNLVLAGGPVNSGQWMKLVLSLQAQAPGQSFLTFSKYICISGLNSYEWLALEIAKVDHKRSIVDVGCGDGTLYPILEKSIKSDFKYIGIDVSPSELLIGTKRFSEECVSFEYMDVLAAPFNIGPTDIFACHMVLQMFTELGLGLRNLSASLKPNGQIIAVIRNYDYRKTQNEKISLVIKDFFKTNYPNFSLPFGDPRISTLKGISAILDESESGLFLSDHREREFVKNISREDYFDHLSKIFPLAFLPPDQLSRLTTQIDLILDPFMLEDGTLDETITLRMIHLRKRKC